MRQFLAAFRAVRVPDADDYPHVFVLIDDGAITAGCTCGWFEEEALLDENSARAMHHQHVATLLT